MPNWYWEKKELRATPSQEKGKKNLIESDSYFRFPNFLMILLFIALISIFLESFQEWILILKLDIVGKVSGKESKTNFLN